MSIAEVSEEKKTHIERLECELATAVKKGRQSVAESREISETGSCLVAGGEDSFQGL